MNYDLTLQSGMVVLADEDQRKHFMSRLKRAMALENERARFNAVAQIVYPPIRKVAEYLEWTHFFFVPDSVEPGQHVRIAIDREYTAVALFSSPDGEIMYTRPTREYGTISFRQIDCGLEFDWDIAEYGWDVVGMKLMEAAEELARRRDELRQPLLDAAAISQAGHMPTVATTLSKASVDNIIQSSATVGFPVTQVAVNSGTLMDMSTWTLPANSMIGGSMPPNIGGDIFTKLFSNGYGNLKWVVNHSIPSNYLYFSGPPSKVGWFWTKGGIRTASEQDIDRGMDKHTWRQKIAARVEGSQWVWKLEIT